MKFDPACAALQRKHWRAHARVRWSRLIVGAPLGLAIISAGLLGGCAASSDPSARSDTRLSRPSRKFTSADYGARVIAPGAPVPRGGGVYKVGAPYQMGGKWYVPREEPGYNAVGMASWYGEDFHGRRTANGEIYDMHGLTAAHPTLPLPSYAWVTNQSNGRTVLVRINDRGPYARDRIIDLSRAAARELGYEGHGTAPVRVRYAGPAPLDGNDARERQVLAQVPWRRGPRLADTSTRQPTWTPPSREPVRPTPAQPAVFAEQPRTGRDDYLVVKAQGRLSAAPVSSEPMGLSAAARSRPVQQADDGSSDDGTPSWSVSTYRQGISGQRRSLGGPQ